MGFSRGPFGIEYNSRPPDEGSGGWGWAVLAIAVLTVVSLAWTFVVRSRSNRDDVPAIDPAPPAAEVQTGQEPVGPVPVNVSQAAENSMSVAEPPERGEVAFDKRPREVRNLLMRLEEARRTNDIEMEATTIERLRSLPGAPAADLDDKLARRLGVLNLRRLYEKRNRLWVSEIAVKRGDSASRIAKEHGSTLASLARLNGGKVDRVFVGQRLFVMNHPRFNLVVHRRSRTADLQLNGKFFRRYDLEGTVSGEAGAYELPQSARSFWASAGIRLKTVDRNELETLLPAGTSVLISEM